jgi:hypothetical protein
VDAKMELKVSLDFACSGCAQNVIVTLECKGSGLFSETGATATVNVPCPTCGAVNRVEFEPGGTLVAVSPCLPRRRTIEPSIN